MPKKTSRGKKPAQSSASSTVPDPPAGAPSSSPTFVRKFLLRSLGRGKKLAQEYWNDIAGTGWEHDPVVVQAALFGGVPIGRIQTCLWKDRSFVEDLFSSAPKKVCKQLWSKMTWKKNAELHYRAFGLGIIPYDSLPAKYKKKDQVLRALAMHEIRWNQLSLECKRDIEYFLASDPSHDDFVQAMEVVQDKDRLLQFSLDNIDNFYFPEEYWTPDGLPPHVFGNPETLLRVASVAPEVLEYASMAVFNVDFVKELVTTNPLVLQHLPLFAAPDLVDAAWNEQNLRNYHGRIFCDVDDLEYTVPMQLWNSQSFVNAWIRAGGSVSENIADDILENEETYLELARAHKNRSGIAEDGFDLLPPNLASSSSLCFKLVRETHIMNWFDAFDEEVTADVNLISQGLACSELYDPEGLLGIVDALKERLDDFEVFFKIILCGMKRPTSTLHRLGGDSSISRAIGEFLGVPLPSYYLQALANIGTDIFHPYSRDESYQFLYGDEDSY